MTETMDRLSSLGQTKQDQAIAILERIRRDLIHQKGRVRLIQRREFDRISAALVSALASGADFCLQADGGAVPKLRASAKSDFVTITRNGDYLGVKVSHDPALVAEGGRGARVMVYCESKLAGALSSQGNEYQF